METTMALQLMLDGALAAAELLALLFAPPAAAREPAAIDQPVQLHRLSSAVGVRLLGSLADARIAQALPVGEGDDFPLAGHARLTDDERIADALRQAPGARAVMETAAALPSLRSGWSCRAMLPVRVDAAAPRAMLVDLDEDAFLLIVPHRAAPRGTLVLRPAAGEPETLSLGAIDARHAVLVPLPGRAHLDRLAAGAVELELADDRGTWWTTLIAERVDDRPALQTRGAE
jgi:hypothetical protein